MRTIAIMNLKGGVAKTTTTVNVAAILAHDHNKNVLVVDADSQCNTTEFFGADPANGNLADVLRYKSNGLLAATDAADLIQISTVPHVDILAGDDALMDLDLTKVETGGVSPTLLRDMVEMLGSLSANIYDFCLIDCPPAFNAASAAALLAADEVLIPIKLDAFSLRGMANLMRQIHNMKAINPELRLLGLLPTMWYRSPSMLKAAAELKDAGLTVLPPIRMTRKVDDMTFAQRPLIESSPRSAAAQDYRRLVADLLKGGESNG